MKTISLDQLTGALEWRYATKIFDPSQKIPAETWQALERTLVLSPSSFGLQPYQFLIATDPKVREQLLPHTWGQKQVVDCSHYVVFTARTILKDEHVDEFIERVAKVRGIPAESLKAYRDMMHGDLIMGARSKIIPEWSARQAYIALGNLMTSAALIGIDACPIEGFEPAKYNEVLKLNGTGFGAVVCCALGYRAASDKYSTLPKVRQPETQLVQHV
jgi:nitroreductase